MGWAQQWQLGVPLGSAPMDRRLLQLVLWFSLAGGRACRVLAVCHAGNAHSTMCCAGYTYRRWE